MPFVKGYKATEEHRRRLSESHKGKSPSKEQRMKISNSLKGRKLPEETKVKIREARAKQVPPMLGKGGKMKEEDYTLKYYLKRLEDKSGRKRPERCEICNRVGRICFDHDHNTGKFRGWICLNCNSAIGFVYDNPEILIEMIKYLNKNVK